MNPLFTPSQTTLVDRKILVSELIWINNSVRGGGGGGGGGGVVRKLGKGEGRELEHELLFFTKLFLRSE